MRKNILITGGSRGIGLGIAHELVQAGYNLAINGVRSEQEVDNVLSSLRSYGPKVIYCQGDISQPSERNDILSKIDKDLGVLNALVNNAGVAPKERNDLLEMSLESYERVMDINLKGPFFSTQQVARQMIESKSQNNAFDGCIVNITSVSAETVSISRGQYCLSKSGLHMMSKLFAVRLAPHGIPVYEIQPGVIETDMTATVLEKYKKLVEDGLTLEPRLGTPKDVGLAVRALVEKRISYATGQVIKIDGGMSIPTL